MLGGCQRVVHGGCLIDESDEPTRRVLDHPQQAPNRSRSASKVCNQIAVEGTIWLVTTLPMSTKVTQEGKILLGVLRYHLVPIKYQNISVGLVLGRLAYI